MKNRISRNSLLLLSINTIRRIIDIFLGPFLTAFFFKIVIDNIKIISIYNIFLYLMVAFFSLVVGGIIRNKYKMAIFRVGMVSKIIQLLIIIFLGNKVVNYICILGIIGGFSTITWAFPLNLFSSTLIQEKEKKSYIVYRTILNNLSKVVIPFLLGTIIYIKSFKVTAIIILFLTIFQIILSLFIKDNNENNEINNKLNILNEFKKIKNNDKLKKFYKMKFFKGLAYEGALETTITLLIIITFKTNFSLGIVTSITSLLAVLSSWIYRTIKNEKVLKRIIMISSVLILLVSFLLIIFPNNVTIVIYNLVFYFLIQFIMVPEEVKTLKFTDSDIITYKNRVETYVLLEFFLNLGRIMGYLLLFVIGLFFNIYILEILIIVLEFAIILEAINLIKFD